ncbi:MAG: DUF3365 domain-containing protein [Pseudomonas sp.]|uniref:Tll0287-like domain-containing protein n=1 Tax=Pseudomonas sp. TaxID=306 RepID=UPI0033943C43
MNAALRTTAAALLTALVIQIWTAPAIAAEDVEATGKDLTLIFRSARKVISDSQDLINDASKGDKGLDATTVIERTKANYLAAAGKELDLNDDGSPAAKARAAMLSAVRTTIDQAQPLINEPGKGFKGFLPAVFGGRVASSFSTSMAGTFSIKLTAPKAYVRSRANRPDEWESQVIETMFKRADYEKGKAYAEAVPVKGRAAYRYILPEYYGPSCLGCHGEPKGEVDVTGGKKEGAKLNELGGAVSLIIYQ